MRQKGKSKNTDEPIYLFLLLTELPPAVVAEHKRIHRQMRSKRNYKVHRSVYNGKVSNLRIMLTKYRPMCNPINVAIATAA